jgi:hypothetical protein
VRPQAFDIARNGQGKRRIFPWKSLEKLGKIWRGASATSAADRLAGARRLKAYVAAHK